MSDGCISNLIYSSDQTKMLVQQEPVARIVVYQRSADDYLCGFRFYSKANEALLEVGDCNYPPTEFPLVDGERVLGIRSRLSSKGHNPWHCDLQFIIGRMKT